MVSVRKHIEKCKRTVTNTRGDWHKDRQTIKLYFQRK